MKATPLPAPMRPAKNMVQRAFEMISNTAPFDITHHPAMSIPCGMVDGLPVGLMLIGRHFDEMTIYRAAHAFEQSGDWKNNVAAETRIQVGDAAWIIPSWPGSRSPASARSSFWSCWGLGIIASMMGIFNFAQGEFVLLGAYITYHRAQHSGLPVWLGMAIAPFAGRRARFCARSG